MWGRNWCCLGICALALGLAIFIVAIFPVGFLMFLVALLLVVCGWYAARRHVGRTGGTGQGARCTAQLCLLYHAVHHGTADDRRI